MSEITTEDYSDISQVSGPRLSPDGSTVAFLKRDPETGESYETTVHVAPTDGTGSRQFTLAEDTESEVEWCPDGDRLAFVSDRSGTPELWVIPANGGEGRQITAVAGAVRSISWHPDGRKIAFVQEVTAHEREEALDIERDDEYEREEPDPRVISRVVYRSAGGYFDGRRSHIYVADVETGDIERLTDGDADFDAPEWGADETLYYTERLADQTLYHDIHATDVETGATETIGATHDWSPVLAANDEGLLAYTFFAEEGPNPALNQTEVRVTDGEEDVSLTRDIDRTVEGGPVWGPDCEYVYVKMPNEGEDAIRRLRRDGSDSEDVVTGHEGRIAGFDVGNEQVAVSLSQWDHPGDIFVYERGTDEPTRLTRVNEEYLRTRAVQEPTELWVESDGTEIQAWMLTPPGFDERESYPLVVEIHGGPSVMWTTSGTMWHEFQLLASQGYVVAWCNPRGSTGYGQDHTMAIATESRPDYTDILSVTEELLSREYVDESNVFVTGGSFGGFMTGWIVGHTDLFTAGVAQRGVYDQLTQYGSKDFFHSTRWRHGDPLADRDQYWENSPIAYADRVETPTLILHSDRDFRVPVHNAELFYRLLKLNGVKTELVRYRQGTHELSRSGDPAYVRDRLNRIVEWFDRHSRSI